MATHNANKGSENGKAKLNEEKVVALRQEYVNGATRAELAKKYGISTPGLIAALNGTTWKHVPMPPELIDKLLADSTSKKPCPRLQSLDERVLADYKPGVFEVEEEDPVYDDNAKEVQQDPFNPGGRL